MHLYFVFLYMHLKLLCMGCVLESIFLHQDSRTWCFLLFFVFFVFCVCLFTWSSLWQCALVLLLSRLLRVLFVCFCLFALSFKNNIMSLFFASSTLSHFTPFQSNHEDYQMRFLHKSCDFNVMWVLCVSWLRRTHWLEMAPPTNHKYQVLDTIIPPCYLHATSWNTTFSNLDVVLKSTIGTTT